MYEAKVPCRFLFLSVEITVCLERFFLPERAAGDLHSHYGPVWLLHPIPPPILKQVAATTFSVSLMNATANQLHTTTPHAGYSSKKLTEKHVFMSQLWFLLEWSCVVPRPPKRRSLPQHEPARHQGDDAQLRQDHGGEYQAEGFVVQYPTRALAMGECRKHLVGLRDFSHKVKLRTMNYWNSC